MEESAFRKEERYGLAVAFGLHVLLFAALLFQPGREEVLDIPERMTVSLAEEVALEATAPDPVPESQAAVAPTLAEQPAPVPDVAQPEPQPRPVVTPREARPSITAPKKVNERPKPKPSSTPAKPAGGTRIGDNFLGGAGSSTKTDETRIPASQIGASAKANLIQAISRQIKPHWNAPSGLDAELLVTELAFDLNEDGTLKGAPRVLRQSGINDSNRPQASLHAERAIRAVVQAAPFDLPAEYYNAWKSIRGARFDRNLSR